MQAYFTQNKLAKQEMFESEIHVNTAYLAAEYSCTTLTSVSNRNAFHVSSS